MSLNKVMLIGRIGKDPEFRVLPDGKEMASFSLATSEKWKDKTSGESKEKTEWHKISIFNPNLVKLVKSYAKKGTQLYVEGSMQTRKYQDKQGIEKYTTEIILSAFGGNIILLDKKEELTNYDPVSNNPYRMGTPTSYEAKSFSIDDDEIPF